MAREYSQSGRESNGAGALWVRGRARRRGQASLLLYESPIDDFTGAASDGPVFAETGGITFRPRPHGTNGAPKSVCHGTLTATATYSACFSLLLLLTFAT